MKKDTKKASGLVIIVLFIIVLLMPKIFSILGLDNVNKTNEGIEEKRTLATFPTNYTDKYFHNIENWYADHSPMRNSIIRINNNIIVKLEDYFDDNIRQFLMDLFLSKPQIRIKENNVSNLLTTIVLEDDPSEPPNCIHNYADATIIHQSTCIEAGIREQICAKCGYHKKVSIQPIPHKFRTIWENKVSDDMNGFTLAKCNMCGFWDVQNFTQKLNEHPLAPIYKSKSQSGNLLSTAIIGKNKWYFYAGDNTEKYYMGDNLLTEDDMMAWKKSLDALQRICDERGILLAIALAPNKEEMYPEFMPTTYIIKTDIKRAERFYKYMQRNSTTHYEYLKDALEDVKKVFPVYFKQDTHWNHIGGFVGTMQLYKAVGLPITNIFNLYEEGLVTQRTNNGGDLANFVGKSTTYIDFHVNYKTNMNIHISSNGYANHVLGNGNTSELVVYTNSHGNGKKVVVVADSFRHFIEDYVKRDFDKSTIAHRNELIFRTPVLVNSLKELGKGDVIFLLAVERFDKQNIKAANELVKIFNTFISEGSSEITP